MGQWGEGAYGVDESLNANESPIKDTKSIRLSGYQAIVANSIIYLDCHPSTLLFLLPPGISGTVGKGINGRIGSQPMVDS
jgi:hypothetical protein